MGRKISKTSGADQNLIEVKRDNKGKIWSHLRFKWLDETPEERVRQEYLPVKDESNCLWRVDGKRFDRSRLVVCEGDAAHFREMPSDWIPWQVLRGNTYKHYEEHARELKEWLNKKVDWNLRTLRH